MLVKWVRVPKESQKKKARKNEVKCMAGVTLQTGKSLRTLIKPLTFTSDRKLLKGCKQREDVIRSAF